MSLFADTIAPVRRTQPDQVFVVRLVVVPAPDGPDAGGAGGAYANCWVDSDDLRSAEQTTLEAIDQEGWEPQKFEHWDLVTRASYEQDAGRNPEERSESVEHVEEAFAQGYCLVFYCWSPDAPDGTGDA